MKKVLVASLVVGAFMVGMPFVKSAHADIRSKHNYRVPEPTTLGMLAAGGMGVGVFNLIRRRSRKKNEE